MKKFLLLVLVLVAAVTPGFAQEQVNVNDQIEVLRAQTETERKAIISLNLQLTEEESTAFWPIYNEYRNEMQTVNDRMITLIKKYGENYTNLTDAVAAELITEAMDIEDDRIIYKRIYVEDLLNILPTRKVAILFQIENKIEAALKYELAIQVPYVPLAEEPNTDTNEAPAVETK